jgi:RNA polymerase primary sigma factor
VRERSQPTDVDARAGLRSLEALADELRRLPPLTADEQKGLLAHARDRDPGARERLLESYLPMVMRLARERGDRGLPIGDLFQEGSVGLMSAIVDYPSSAETDFDRYAERRAAESMDAALASEASAVEQDRLLVQAATDYDRVELRLARELRRKPTTAEIGKALEWDQERTEYVAELVEDARRRFDEEILNYLDPADGDAAAPDAADGADGDDAARRG